MPRVRTELRVIFYVIAPEGFVASPEEAGASARKVLQDQPAWAKHTPASIENNVQEIEKYCRDHGVWSEEKDGRRVLRLPVAHQSLGLKPPKKPRPPRSGSGS